MQGRHPPRGAVSSPDMNVSHHGNPAWRGWSGLRVDGVTGRGAVGGPAVLPLCRAWPGARRQGDAGFFSGFYPETVLGGPDPYPEVPVRQSDTLLLELRAGGISMPTLATHVGFWSVPGCVPGTRGSRGGTGLGTCLGPPPLRCPPSPITPPANELKTGVGGWTPGPGPCLSSCHARALSRGWQGLAPAGHRSS